MWAPCKVQMGSAGGPRAVLGARGCTCQGRSELRWGWTGPLHAEGHRGGSTPTGSLSGFSPGPPQPGRRPSACVHVSPGVSRAPGRLGVGPLSRGGGVGSAHARLPRHCHSTLWVSQRRCPGRRHSRRQTFVRISVKATCKLLSVKTSAL